MFAALFVIITAFHGLYILIMRCLHSKDVINGWKKCFFGMTGKHSSEFALSILPHKHQKQVQAMKKSGETTDAIKELRIFGHKDAILEKHSINKGNEIKNQLKRKG